MTLETTMTSPFTAVKGREAAKAGGKITVFHCFHAVDKIEGEGNGLAVNAVNLPCSSMTREVVLLKAFEAGADAVVVLVCPEGACRHINGNIRAAKRVGQVKKILDAIGLDGRRLNIYNVSSDDGSAVAGIIGQTAADIAVLGPNPAA